MGEIIVSQLYFTESLLLNRIRHLFNEINRKSLMCLQQKFCLSRSGTSAEVYGLKLQVTCDLFFLNFCLIYIKIVQILIIFFWLTIMLFMHENKTKTLFFFWPKHFYSFFCFFSQVNSQVRFFPRTVQGSSLMKKHNKLKMCSFTIPCL